MAQKFIDQDMQTAYDEAVKSVQARDEQTPQQKQADRERLFRWLDKDFISYSMAKARKDALLAR